MYVSMFDTTQLAKHIRDNSHCDQSSQHSRQGPTKYWKDLRRRKIGRPEHQMFFFMVFLQDKNV